ncbi:MAG: hypothetical protein AB7G06_07735 [Bdellovibrionales bacterium]
MSSAGAKQQLSQRHLAQNPDVIADCVKIDLAYGHGPSAHSLNLFYKLVPEEMAELAEAMEEFRVTCANGTPDKEKLANLVKESYDVAALGISLMHMLGVDITAAWNAITQNNFDKLDPVTGQPLRNEFGKVQKPAHWRKVDLAPVVEKDFDGMLETYKEFGKTAS